MSILLLPHRLPHSLESGQHLRQYHRHLAPRHDLNPIGFCRALSAPEPKDACA